MGQLTQLCTFILALGLTFHSSWSYCLLPESRGLLAKCYSAEGQIVSCQKKVPSGITVELICKDYYKGNPLHRNRRRCSEEGTWTGEPISCSPECGTSEVSFQPYITYGKPTIRGQWPWNVAIYERNNGGWRYHCGGSLISEDTVLTSAACATHLSRNEPFDNEEVLVVLGKHFREENIREEHSQSIQVRRISVHPEFNSKTVENDLALIFLNTPVDITYDVRTICSPINEHLSEEVQLQEGSKGVAVGFGITETGEMAYELQHAIIPYIPDSRCSENIPEQGQTVLKPTIFCAGNLNDTNICHGDGGSGLVFLYENSGKQRWYIQGVASGGLQQLDFNSPFPCSTKITFFTKVSFFKDWIEEEMRQMEDSGNKFHNEIPSKKENDLMNLVQAAVAGALENTFKSLYEKMDQIVLQEQETANEVKEMKIYKEQQLTNLQTQIDSLKKISAMEDSSCKASNTIIANKLNVFEKKVDETGDLIFSNSNVRSNQLRDLENQIKELETRQMNLNDAISFIKDKVKQDYCGGNSKVPPSNCAEIQQSGQTTSGVYKITTSSGVIEVYCDLETDGGGWTVFQRRDDVTSHISFNRNWEEYKKGFGDINQEFWLGLDTLHLLTKDRHMSLRVDMADFEGNRKFAHYDHFLVKSEAEKYQLFVDGFQGDAGNSLFYHKKQSFSTWDKDNDEVQDVNCVQRHSGGWWFRDCVASNLNGMYRRGPYSGGYGDGIIWTTWKRFNYSLKTTEMKLRPIYFQV